jgi:hypothetical protein
MDAPHHGRARVDRETIAVERDYVRQAVGTILGALLALPSALLAVPPPRGRADWYVVPEARILRLMQGERGYDLTATPNGPRLEADVLRRLIREREAEDPERRPLFLGHREWYEAFLARTRLASSAAPLYARLSYEVGQDMLVDYRREAVIDAVLRGPTPCIVADVWLFWSGKPDQYSYDDVSSHPHLRVTQARVVTYRFVDYDDRLWYTDVQGLRGRPTSGALGVLFDLIGEGHVEESRSAMLPDGTQVVRGRASKWGLSRTVTLTIWPDGRADRGVPADRPDLRVLAARLKEPLEIRFKPMPPELPPALGEEAGQ